MISSAATTKIEEDHGLEEEVKMEKEMGETVVPSSSHDDDEVKKVGRRLAVTSIALVLAVLTGTLYHR